MSAPIAPTLRSGSLPLLVLLMTVLAGLAFSGLRGVETLAQSWAGASRGAATIEIPPDLDDAQTKAGHLLATLRQTPGITAARILPDGDVRSLLAPWLGTVTAGKDAPSAITFPIVLVLQHRPDITLEPIVHAALPEAVVEEDLRWSQRLQDLGATLVACAWLAVSLIAAIVILSIGITVRRSVAAQRRAVEIVHMIGATGRQISGRISRRAALLTFGGSLAGLACLTPVLATLATRLSQIQDHAPQPGQSILFSLPQDLLLTLAGLPIMAALLAWMTAECVVRFWLQRLP